MGGWGWQQFCGKEDYDPMFNRIKYVWMKEQSLMFHYDVEYDKEYIQLQVIENSKTLA